MTFFRFPRTPHLAWPGRRPPRDDKVLSAGEADELLAHELVVEEKIDGANVGLSTGENGQIQVQNRGGILTPENAHPQFRPLFRWMAKRRVRLERALAPDLMLFGEWCYAVHTVRYNALPDWLLAFDVYDRSAGLFWSSDRRDRWIRRLGLAPVPILARGRFDLQSLQRLMIASRFGGGPAEGLYLRRDDGPRLSVRAKLVRPGFAEPTGPHWTRRPLERNALSRPDASRGTTNSDGLGVRSRRSPEARSTRPPRGESP